LLKTKNPKPKTLNQKPETKNLKPETNKYKQMKHPRLYKDTQGNAHISG